MGSYKTVALAGATGAVGAPVLQALLDANFTVTALTRESSTSTFPTSVKVVKVDYDNVDNLTAALQGQDVLISTMGTAAIGQQVNLVDAAIAAGVKRLIPSEFGNDLSLPKLRQLPVYAQKVQIEEDIEKKCRGTGTTYTFIFTNAFLDWSLDNNFSMDLRNKKIELFDGGDVSFATTPLPMVAKGTVAVLHKAAETENRAVRIQGTAITQKKLFGIAQRVVGKDGWTITEADTADRERQSYENLKNDPGNVFGWVIGFLQRAVWGEGYGGDFSKDNDNELLGLKELSEEEVEDIVRSRA